MSHSTGENNSKISREYVIRNRYGIHARPAALFVKIASRYDADVYVEKDDAKVSGKSIMGLMTLEAGRGASLTINAEGPDSEQVLDELQSLFESGFDEE